MMDLEKQYSWSLTISFLMAPKLTRLYLFILLCQGVHLDYNGNMQRKLLDYLKNETSELLPVEDYSEVVQVEFGITLIKIKDVNAKEQTIQVHLWITQKWQNPFLKWDARNFGNISSINMKADNIWVPDIVLYNNVDEQDRTGGGRETYKTLVTLYSNGTNFWSSPSLFKAICEIKVEYFPLDRQICKLKFGSWTYNSDKLRIVPKTEPFPSEHYIRNGEWGIYHVDVRANNMSYVGRPDKFMDVTWTIKMQRQFWDYMINLVIPCLMISSMTFLGFILPPESGERIGLSITVLLAMTVFQQLTSEIMPSYDFPLLGQYYFATILEIGAALLVTTIILNFYHRTNRHMPNWLRIVILQWMARMVFLHESAEKCTKPRKRTIKRGIRENIDAVINNGYAIGEHPLTTDTGNRNGNGCENDETLRQRSNTLTTKTPDQNVLKLTLGSIGSELNPNTQDLDGLFTDESGIAVSEDEMRMRHQQWTLAAKILDRFALWMSLVGGIATFVGIFLRAPRFWDVETNLDS